MPDDYETIILLRRHLGPLYIKSMLKLLILFFIAIQFLQIHPVITLIVLLIGYFTMPTTYYTTEPFKAAEAWMRLIVGYTMAVLLFVVFSGMSTTIGNILYHMLFIPVIVAGGPALSLFLLTIAFFVTFPRKEKSPGEEKVIVNVWGAKHFNRLSTGAGTEFIGNLFFIILVLIAGIPILTQWITGASFSLVFTVIWIVSMIIGWVGGREGRPYIGIFVVGVAFLAFSFAFTGTVGQAIFGQFWAPVEAFGTTVFAPVGDALAQAEQGISDAMLLMTCPSCYYELQEQRRRATSVTRNTIKAIESTIELIGVGAEINPSEPLVGTLELKNDGEFTGSNLTVKLENLQLRDPKYQKWVDAGVGGEFRSCGDGVLSVSKDQCSWRGEDKKIYPGDSRYVSFIYQKGPDQRHLGDVLNICNCYDEEYPEGSMEAFSCISDNWDKCDEGQTLAFRNATQMVKVSFSYEFDYFVNVSLEVDVMESDLLTEKLQTREITLQEKTSEYQGGPAMIAIWTQKQPIRSGEPTIGQISVMNQLDGTILNGAEYTFYIPDLDEAFEPNSFSKLSSKYLECTLPTKVTSGPYKDDYYSLICELERTNKDGLSSNEIANYKFDYVYDIGENEQKTTIFVGSLKYRYQGEGLKQLPLTRLPT